MTKEFVKGLRYQQLEKAYQAYTELMSVYEDVCSGPYGARAHKEYFAICDSRDNIRQEVVNRSKTDGYGKQ